MVVTKRLILLRNYNQETSVTKSKHPGNDGCVKVKQTFPKNSTTYI